MKKIALVSLLAAAVAMPAFAADTAVTTDSKMKLEAAPNTNAAVTANPSAAVKADVSPAATDKIADKDATPAPGAAAPAAGSAMTAAKPVELKDGNWAQVKADGTVWVSKDKGKTWSAAPDGSWEAKDGSKITTKAGKKV